MCRTTLIACLLLALIAGCGGGTDVRLVDASQPLPAPDDGVTGVAIKGAIGGGSVTVTDASGATLEITGTAFTQPRGRYALTFSEATVSGGIEAPMTVLVTGGTSICDIDQPDTTDDCPIDDDVFVAFGESFALAEDFSMRATLGTLPTRGVGESMYTINISPATELAARLAADAAGGSALTSADVESANQQIIALLERLTGIELTVTDLVQEPVFDITMLDATGANASTTSLVLVAFASAVLAELDPTDTDVDTLTEVVVRIQSELSVSDDGNLVASGETLSRLSASMVTGLRTVNLQLEAFGTSRQALIDAQALAQANIGTFSLIGDEDVEIAGVSADAMALTRSFARELDQAIRLPSGDLTNGPVSLIFAPDGTGTFSVQLGGSAVTTGTLESNGSALFADGSAEVLSLPPAD